MGVIQEFKEFLNEYKVLGVAVAFIMAGAATALVQALVKDVIMPIVNPLLQQTGGQWQTATFAVGPVNIAWGDFLFACINFIILAFVVFMIAKYVMKEEKVAKK